MKDEYGEIVELIIPMYKDKVTTFDLEVSSGDIVRCKDCKFGEKANSVYLCGKSRGFGIAHEPNWFCADGEI
jgi:hypothetical protein